MEKTLKVFAQWDAEAGVWVASSEDVPGLATESSSLDALLKKLADMIPELLELNVENSEDYCSDVPFSLISEAHTHLGRCA